MQTEYEVCKYKKCTRRILDLIIREHLVELGNKLINYAYNIP